MQLKLTQLVTNPEAALYTVATALFYPILLLLTGALIWIVFEFGRFTVEMLRRDRKRSIPVIEAAAAAARLSLAAGNQPQAVADLSLISSNWLVGYFMKLLGSTADFSRPRLLKLVVETEALANKRLDRTRIWIRLGPIIGLITTLIPISPALVALAKGDLKVLSASLVVAFSTTVIALLISGMAFVMSLYRERAYMQDISDIEYALELVEV
jgi:biopolymer transport protein ExbB/TolQ